MAYRVDVWRYLPVGGGSFAGYEPSHEHSASHTVLWRSTHFIVDAATYLQVLQPERALGFQALWRGFPDTVAILVWLSSIRPMRGKLAKFNYTSERVACTD